MIRLLGGFLYPLNLELLRAGPHEPEGDAGGADVERLWHGLDTGLVVPAAQAQNDLLEQLGIGGSGELELLLGRQQHIRVAPEIRPPLAFTGGPGKQTTLWCARRA